MTVAEGPVDGREPAPEVGAVHHVVVDERERVEQLEAAPASTHGVARRVAAGSDEGPVAERGAEPLAAGRDELAQRAQRGVEVRVDGAPALDLRSSSAVMRASTRSPTSARHAGAPCDRAGPAPLAPSSIARWYARPLSDLPSGRRYDPPVAEFLTPEWVAELDEAARRSSTLGKLGTNPPFTVELRVHDAPGHSGDDADREDGDGEFVFQVAFADGSARFAMDSPAEPDLLVLLDARFAARIRSGDATVQDALAAGALKVRGDLEGLVSRAAALSAVGDVFAALRS